MKKGKVEVLELDNEVFSVNVFSKDILFTYLFKQDIKDLHSILSELLDTHTVKEPSYCERNGHHYDGGEHPLGKREKSICVTCCEEEPTTPEKKYECANCHTRLKEGDGCYRCASDILKVTTDPGHRNSTIPMPPEKQELPCLCPAWFPDRKGGWIKNTRKDHVEGECLLANVQDDTATPEKKCGCTEITVCPKHLNEWEKKHSTFELPTSSY